MDTIKTYVIPAFILLGLFLSWNFGVPRDFHGMSIPYGARPLQPDASIPTFHSVRNSLGNSSTLDSGEAVGDGVPPHNANENIFKKNRENVRNSTMKGLDKAWSTFCTADGRRKLANTLAHYFERRGNEEDSYAKRWGKDGKAYIEKEWSTPDDNRIERLVSETYERGYLDLASVKPFLAARMAPLLKGVRVRGEPCKGVN
jgi:hypothetical protein